MKPNFKVISTLAVAASLVSAAAQASNWSDLSEKERTKLLDTKCSLLSMPGCVKDITENEVVRVSDHKKLTAKEKEDPIFPEVTAFRLLKGTPAQVAANFTDYKNYATIFKDVKIQDAQELGNTYSKTGDGFQVDVAYIVGIKFGTINSNVHYTLKNIFRKYKNSDGVDSFGSTWELVDSTDLYEVVGFSNIEPVNVNGTMYSLMKYYNYINPKSQRGFLDNPVARKINKDDIAKTLEVLGNYVKTNGNGPNFNNFCGRVGSGTGCP